MSEHVAPDQQAKQILLKMPLGSLLPANLMPMLGAFFHIRHAILLILPTVLSSTDKQPQLPLVGQPQIGLEEEQPEVDRIQNVVLQT